ncbi:MAG: damage-control phosphatase ARMT1 family protein [Candidatus Zipacnadales bacterium]
MRAFLDCTACTVKQALRAARYSTDDVALQSRALRAAMVALAESDLSVTPAELAYIALRAIARETGCADPYAAVRRQSNAMALQLYPRLKELVESSLDRLRTATKIAIAGNVIDFGAVGANFNVEKTLECLLCSPFARDDFDRFTVALREALRVLYLADNAGEIVFDRVLMEELERKDLTVAVKSEPFINDAMLADAESTGIGEVARLIEVPIYPRTNKEFEQAWEKADLVIAKGHANYESYTEREGPTFFLLIAKCEFVAQDAGVRKGEMVLLGR